MVRSGHFPVALWRIGRSEQGSAFGDRRLLILGSSHDEDRLVKTGYSLNWTQLRGVDSAGDAHRTQHEWRKEPGERPEPERQPVRNGGDGIESDGLDDHGVGLDRLSDKRC